MTDPSEVKISDAVVRQHIARMHGTNFIPSLTYIEVARSALQDLIARRVPDAKPDSGVFGNDFHNGHNACRARVLDGEQT